MELKPILLENGNLKVVAIYKSEKERLAIKKQFNDDYGVAIWEVILFDLVKAGWKFDLDHEKYAGDAFIYGKNVWVDQSSGYESWIELILDGHYAILLSVNQKSC